MKIKRDELKNLAIKGPCSILIDCFKDCNADISFRKDLSASPHKVYIFTECAFGKKCEKGRT